MAEAVPIISPENDSAIKLLVTNREAGCLIGKGGQSIVNLQSKANCRIRVSKAEDLFPTTQDRVVFITGSFSSVSECISIILKHMFYGFPEPDDPSDEPKKSTSTPSESKMITLAIPASAAGVIIGRGGANIKLISTKSGAHLQLTSKERQVPGLNERLLHITGTYETVNAATSIILEKLVEEDSKYELLSTNYRHLSAFIPRPIPIIGQLPAQTGRGGIAPIMHFPGAIAPPSADRRGQPRAPAPQYMGQGRGLTGAAPGYLLPAHHSNVVLGGGAHGAHGGLGGVGHEVEPSTLTMNLPDSAIAAVVGRGGGAIQAIQAQTGARVHLSARGDYVAGTRDQRLVTITGPTYHQAHAALCLISDRAGIPFHPARVGLHM